MVHVNMTPTWEQGLKPIKCLDAVHFTTLTMNCHEGQEDKLGMVKWFTLWIYDKQCSIKVKHHMYTISEIRIVFWQMLHHARTHEKAS
jgi:hypothetical protein